MTHTLHRQGTYEELKEDFVVLVMSAKGFNDVGAAPKLKEALKIIAKYEPVNMGDMTQGSMYRAGFRMKSLERLLQGGHDRSIYHGVYTDLETVKKVIDELKAADLGMSVVISGLYDEVRKIAKPHTVNLALGIWGKTELLPKHEEVLKICTMCGHQFVSRNLVMKLAQDVKRGRITAEEAAEVMAACCSCGIFNPVRAVKLIKQLVQKL
ncbi:MAG: hypothetical protein QW267_00775 [Sulfolobales archaeon]